MRKQGRFSKVFLLATTLMLLCSVAIFAATGETTITLNPNDTDAIGLALGAAANKTASEEDGVDEETLMAEDVFVASSDKSSESELLLFHLEDNQLMFYQDNFDKAKQKETKKALSAFIDALKDSSISSDTQSDIMNDIRDSNSDVKAMMLPMIFDNTQADLFTAYKWLFPFLAVVRVLFGLGAIVIILLTIASTIMDLAYMGLPMWRESTAEKTGKQKPFGVSWEALSTVTEVETKVGEYKNAYLIYLKRRAITYVVLSVAILWLVAGEMSGLIGWLLSLGGGLVG